MVVDGGTIIAPKVMMIVTVDAKADQRWMQHYK
jgi:hypothetical protein